MKVSLRLIMGGVLLWAAGPVPAGEPATAGPLAAAQEKEAAAREALQKKAAAAQSALQHWYTSALDVLKNDAAGKRDAAGVLAAEQEKARVSRDLTPAEWGALPPRVKALRGLYEQTRAQHTAQLKQATVNLLKTYATSLGELERELAQKGDLAGAQAAHTAREQAQAEQRDASARKPEPPGAVAADGTRSTPAVPGKEVPAVLKDFTNTRWTWVDTNNEGRRPSWMEFLPNGETRDGWGTTPTWRLEGSVIVIKQNDRRTWRFQMEPDGKLGRTIVKSSGDEDRTIRFDRFVE